MPMAKKIENEYQPDELSAPGETLLEVLEERGLTQTTLARRTGRPKKTINEIIKGKTTITAETALQLERVLGVPASFWNARQRDYEEWRARRDERASLEGHVDWLKQFPVRDLVKLGWIEKRKDKVEQLRELLSFFGVVSPDQWAEEWTSPSAAFRASSAFEANEAAVAAWLRRGEIEGREMPCNAFDPDLFRGSLAMFRGLTREPIEKAIKDLVRTAAMAGVAIVFIRSVKGVRASGATRWLSPDKALMQLNLRYRRADQLWFTVFHEVGHILLHGKKRVFIENGEKDDEEHEANEFAADFLIRPKDYRRFVAREVFTRTSVTRFAAHQGISPGIVLGRLQREKHIPFDRLNGLHDRLKWADE